MYTRNDNVYRGNDKAGKGNDKLYLLNYMISGADFRNSVYCMYEC